MYKVDQIEAISQNCDTILICGSQFMLTGSHENIAVDDIRYTERCFKYKRFHKKYVGAVFGLYTVKMYFRLKNCLYTKLNNCMLDCQFSFQY